MRTSPPSAANFQTFLKREFIRRCDANKSYSLRSFARSLNVSHATLSAIIAGKRPLTTKSIIKLSSALKLDEADVQRFLEETAPNEKPKTSGSSRSHQVLTLDVFHVVADWYHDAILELTHTKHFRGDMRWIAKTLGISKVEVEAAVERLVRLDLLEIESDEWKDLSRNNTTNLTNDLSSAALRKLQEKVLESSVEALRTLNRTERDHSSLTVAMQRSDLDEVKARIKAFRFELVDFIERKGVEPDAVFQFAFSAFPLTRNLERD